MRRRTAALHTLVGAYVMDAVPEADRAAFERHLGGCPACREEVRGLREATARLASASAIEPRPELREQTLQAAARLRQMPPLVGGQPETARAGRMARFLPLALRRLPSGGRPFRSGWLNVLTAAAVVLAVAFAGTAIGLGLNSSSMQHRLSAAEQRDHAIAAVLTAKDAVMRTTAVTTGGTATVVMSHRERSLVFIASKLSALPAARGYEVWLMGPSGDRSAGMLPAQRGGMYGPMVVSGLRAGDQVGLTVEPAGGSPRPTTPPIVLVGLGD
jgi:Anti-sigma-K factor rskA/Putative zinc-finger